MGQWAWLRRDEEWEEMLLRRLERGVWAVDLRVAGLEFVTRGVMVLEEL